MQLWTYHKGSVHRNRGTPDIRDRYKIDAEQAIIA